MARLQIGTGNLRIEGVSAPTTGTDAANMAYVDNRISEISVGSGDLITTTFATRADVEIVANIGKIIYVAPSADFAEEWYQLISDGSGGTSRQYIEIAITKFLPAATEPVERYRQGDLAYDDASDILYYVPTTGNYRIGSVAGLIDLSTDTDTVPNNATITLQVNGTDAGSFTTDQNTDETINLTVATGDDVSFTNGPAVSNEYVSGASNTDGAITLTRRTLPAPSSGSIAGDVGTSQSFAVNRAADVDINDLVQIAFTTQDARDNFLNAIGGHGSTYFTTSHEIEIVSASGTGTIDQGTTIFTPVGSATQVSLNFPSGGEARFNVAVPSGTVTQFTVDYSFRIAKLTQGANITLTDNGSGNVTIAATSSATTPSFQDLSTNWPSAFVSDFTVATGDIYFNDDVYFISTIGKSVTAANFDSVTPSIQNISWVSLTSNSDSYQYPITTILSTVIIDPGALIEFNNEFYIWSGGSSITINDDAARIANQPGTRAGFVSLGGGATILNDLTDVDTTTTAPVDNDFLVYDGTNWVPSLAPGHTPGTGVTVFPDWNHSAAYAIGDQVLYTRDRQFYEATAAISQGDPAGTTTHHTGLNELAIVTVPAGVFVRLRFDTPQTLNRGDSWTVSGIADDFSEHFTYDFVAENAVELPVGVATLLLPTGTDTITSSEFYIERDAGGRTFDLVNVSTATPGTPLAANPGTASALRDFNTNRTIERVQFAGHISGYHFESAIGDLIISFTTTSAPNPTPFAPTIFELDVENGNRFLFTSQDVVREGGDPVTLTWRVPRAAIRVAGDTILPGVGFLNNDAASVFSALTAPSFNPQPSADPSRWALLSPDMTATGIGIQDEGTTVGVAALVLNFAGDGVTVTGDEASKLVTIPGSRVWQGDHAGGATVNGIAANPDTVEWVDDITNTDVVATNASGVITLAATGLYRFSATVSASSSVSNTRAEFLMDLRRGNTVLATSATYIRNDNIGSRIDSNIAIDKVVNVTDTANTFTIDLYIEDTFGSPNVLTRANSVNLIIERLS